MSDTPHADAFALAIGTAPALGEAERRLRAFVTRARTEHPAIDADAVAFIAHVGTLVSPVDALEAALEKLRPADLWLAFGCLSGSPAAQRALEAMSREHVRQLVTRFGPTLDADDIGQQLLEHILRSRADKRPRLAEYSGKGELKNWIRVIAQRLLIDEARRGRPDAPSAAGEPDEAIAQGDPELELLEATFRNEFRAAFAHAFGRLSSRERLLLRYRFVDGLGVAQIASVVGNHRVSTSRALGNARRKLLEGVRSDLVGRLRMSASEAHSMMRLMASRIELSLGRLLGTASES